MDTDNTKRSGKTLKLGDILQNIIQDMEITRSNAPRTRETNTGR